MTLRLNAAAVRSRTDRPAGGTRTAVASALETGAVNLIECTILRNMCYHSIETYGKYVKYVKYVKYPEKSSSPSHVLYHEMFEILVPTHQNITVTLAIGFRVTDWFTDAGESEPTYPPSAAAAAAR